MTTYIIAGDVIGRMTAQDPSVIDEILRFIRA